MEETQLKRQRDEAEEEEVEVVKKQKSYKEILSIMEEEEDEPIQDISSLITTLQEEISSSRSTINEQTQLSYSSSEAYPSEIDPSSLEYEAEKVMKRLLEASDDELGIPTTEEATVAGVDGGVAVGDIEGEDWLLPMSFAGGDTLWEIEDEAANYYTLLQSELFL